MIYGVVSDLHCHAWSVFSQTNRAGINSRLEATLSELRRAGDAVLANGGRTLVVAGDVFHTRGVIDPEVLNPTRAAFAELVGKGIEIHIIPGNHDLKSQDTNELSSAVQNLGSNRIHIYNKPTLVELDACWLALMPWRWSNSDLLIDLEAIKNQAVTGGIYPAAIDVFVHAGVDGVLPHLSGGELTDKKLGAFGFRRVFAGHYHNHVELAHGVVSIGATTHQTWGDVNSRAGFLTVDQLTGDVTFNDTRAPKFVDISGLDEDEMALLCPGNFVRFRGSHMTQADINALRSQFTSWGALGTSIEVPKTVVAARSGASPKTGLTLEASVKSYIDESSDLPAEIDRERLKERAGEVLARSLAVYEET